MTDTLSADLAAFFAEHERCGELGDRDGAAGATLLIL